MSLLRRHHVLFLSLGLVACGSAGDPYADGTPAPDAGSTQSPAASTSPTTTTTTPAPPPPVQDAGSADASADAGDAGAAPAAPTCEVQPLHDGASATRCNTTVYPNNGGTFAAGTYNLASWSNGPGTCTSTSTVSGTLKVEIVGGKTYLRYVRFTHAGGDFAVVSSGLQEVLGTAGQFVERTERCTSKIIKTFPFTSGFTATPNEIVLTTSTSQERWVRIPKALPGGPIVVVDVLEP